MAPANAAYVRLVVFWAGAAIPIGEAHYLDGLQLTRGETPIEYFDGDSINGSWTGTPGESISRESINV